VPNLSIGAQVYWPVAPGWKVGVEVDYGAGSISGNAKVPTEAGTAKLSFEQRYDIYTDVYAVAQWKPWPESKRFQPFAFGGIGVAYESDKTTLRLRNDFIDSELRVENSGWFPTYTLGLGADVPFSATSHWFFEFGGAYVWARMTNHVPARGDLAPAPTVTADTDLTGPNCWLGIGRTF
jgi:opacity protein-like surface antigen